MEVFLRDILYGIRILRKSPSFTAVVILTLALGIGVNTAIFSVVDTAIFRPLPYHDADRLVDILSVERRGTGEETRYSGMTRDGLAAWRTQRQIFEDIQAYQSARPMVLSRTDQTQQVWVTRLSPAMPQLLGFRPKLGSGFEFENTRPGNDRVVLVSDGLWKRAFGANLSVLDQTISLDSQSYTIVGVMPSAFRFPIGRPADVWLPLSNQSDPKAPRAATAIIAKLRRGLSLDQAERELDLASAWLQQKQPRLNRWDADLKPLDQRLTRSRRALLLSLLGSAGFVLLIACTNVANLLFSRALNRREEMAIRAALGAGPSRIARHLLIESLLISGFSVAVAVPIAWWSIKLIPGLLPRGLNLFAPHDLNFDWQALTFAVMAAIVSGLLSGLVPALRASRATVAGNLSGSGGMAAAPPLHRRLSNGLLSVQFGLTLLLLAGAGLMINSFVPMVQTDPGFDAKNLIVATIGLNRKAYPTRAVQGAFFDRLLEGVKALAGVRVATIGSPPAAGLGGRFVVEGVHGEGQIAGPATILIVQPDYFTVLGIPFVAGRTFASQDGPTTPPVAIVDQQAAWRYWSGDSAIGKRFRYSPYVSWLKIVGVVGDVKTQAFTRSGDKLEIYLPLSQESNASRRSLIVRTTGDSSPVFTAIRAQVHRLDRHQAIAFAGTIDEMYSQTLQRPRFFLILMSVFAFLALMTAAVGLYGTLSYSVTQRYPEIGIRMALGAEGTDIRGMVMRQACVPVLLGIG